jgi:YesN/AraC family two-component response regulator
LEEQMVSILKHVCEFINRNKKSHNIRLRDDIIKYIEDNYHDINLSITMIADFFHMNPSYLSRFFKEQKGEGLLDFINRVRLERAKYLLQEETLSIVKVARKVGYFNCNTFIRVFKKYEGITPGRYKEIQQSEEFESSS